MRRHGSLTIAICLAVLAVGLIGAPAASAFEEIGNPCVGDATEPDTTMLGLSNQTSEPFMQPVVPPEHKFVITRWRAQVGAGIGPLAQQLVASHQVGEEDDLKVGESAIETLVPGSNEFATRIPVSEYDHIGLRGPEETLICNHPMNTAGRVKGAWATGEARHFEVLVHVGVPAVARVERDADGDGYGDETQDQCPSSAYSQGPCLSVTIDSRVVKVRRGAILVEAATNVDTRVEVRGQAIWPRWGRSLKGVPPRIVALNGGIQQMAPGAAAVFRVPLPKAAIKRLNRTRPRERLKVTLSVVRLDRLSELPGRVTKTLTVKLPGRERRSAQR
ncbi:MAG TPA: hypothetical protein VGV69_09270 [Solirubrobacterales bacterium]|nr:hypothetical protein [Solirubrobacterales bacterium]